MTGAESQEAAPVVDLAAALGHGFADPALLTEAVTHPSVGGITGKGATPRGHGPDYERLEFLGDRVLGLIVAEWLLERFPADREGDLARRHTALVKRETLAEVAELVGIGAYLHLSPGEQGSGGRSNRTILGDACEAVIGALYLDGGMEAARRFVRTHWAGRIEGTTAPPPRDGKTALQEWAQGQGKPLPVYEIVDRSGPAHEPLFEVAVRVKGLPEARGLGRSRRAAETEAARALLRAAGVMAEP